MANSKSELLNYLYEFITPNKIQKIDEVSQKRTRHITVALEDIKESKDASAVIRSCDCFGVQNLHIIENDTKYKINPAVAMGAFKWVDIFSYKDDIAVLMSNDTLKRQMMTPEKIEELRLKDKLYNTSKHITVFSNPEGEEPTPYSNTKLCINNLRSQGYKVVAVSNKGTKTIEEIDYKDKTALLFGSEESGLSDYALEQADDIVKVPSYGVTQSYNLSVSAALTIYNCIQTLKNSGDDFYIKDEELLALKLNWVKRILKRADLLESSFNNSKN